VVYGYRSVTYKPVVRVAYVVGKEPFEANAIHFGRARYFREGDAEAAVRRYPENAEVDVHYNTDDPATCLVEFEEDIARRNLWIGIGLVVLPFVLAYPLVWVIASALTRQPSAKRGRACAPFECAASASASVATTDLSR
jgi:hypothetical protein